MTIKKIEHNSYTEFRIYTEKYPESMGGLCGYIIKGDRKYFLQSIDEHDRVIMLTLLTYL